MNSQSSEQEQNEPAIKSLPTWIRQMLDDRMERYLSAESEPSEQKRYSSEKSVKDFEIPNE